MGAYDSHGDHAPTQTAAGQTATTVLVDLLEREPLIAERSSRDLLARFAGELLGAALQVPESAFRRQWLLAFVDECTKYDGGMHALVEALGRLDGRGRVHGAVAALVGEAREPTAAAAAAVGSAAVAAAAAAAGGLSPAEVDALAETYSDRTAARQLLARAGLPYGRHPHTDGDSYSFWLAVDKLLADGALADGRRRILALASSDYPGQRLFSGPG